MLREYPPYAIAAVGAILISGGKVLLVKRGSSPGKGLWSIPGGVIESGESVYGAARRELAEETGLDANPLGVIQIINVIVKDDNSKIKYHYIILNVLFDDKTVSGKLKAGGDAIDVRFMSPEEILQNREVSMATKTAIELLARRGGFPQFIDVHEVASYELNDAIGI